jgi:hypothetical protein
MPLRRRGTGGSLCATGFEVTRPHRIARPNALETTPAALRTVLVERARASLEVRK